MLILFGWGHKKIKEYGKITPHACSNCGNSASWYLYTVTTYFELFFIPVIPYSTQHFIACPVCNKYIQISDLHMAYFKNFTLLNEGLNSESISEEDYQSLINKLTLAGSDIALNQSEWDFNEEKLAEAKAGEKGITLTKFLKIALPIAAILFILVLL